MARLSGVDIPREKRLEIALTYIYGIGRTRSQKTCAETGINPNTRVKDLTEDDLVKLRQWIDTNYRVEGDCAVRSRRTSAARSRSAATRASGTARGCRSMVSAPTPTRVRARARARPSPARRRPAGSSPATDRNLTGCQWPGPITSFRRTQHNASPEP